MMMKWFQCLLFLLSVAVASTAAAVIAEYEDSFHLERIRMAIAQRQASLSNAPEMADHHSRRLIRHSPSSSSTFTSYRELAPAPTKKPTRKPTVKPSKPTKKPTRKPTKRPTTKKPTKKPTRKPTKKPTKLPTRRPTAKPTVRTVQTRLSEFALGGMYDFIDRNGYQYKALSFVSNVRGAINLSNSKLIQYYALACIRLATFRLPNQATRAYGFTTATLPAWNTSTNWLSTTVDPCSWFGVTCNSTKIVSLNLRANSLTGTFPREIMLLSSSDRSGAGQLNTLDVSYNKYLWCAGDFGLSWMASLGSRMEYLYYGDTSFYYLNGVPPFLNKLVNLKEIDMSYTFAFGPILSTPFITLRKLEYLNMDGNFFNSSIPTVFATLPNLQYFYASNAGVKGDLSFMRGMRSIVELWVDMNSIGGTIPTYVGTLSKLRSFSVTQNRLVGSIPSQLGSIPGMKQMFFYNNTGLTGSLPVSTLNNLKNLTYLEVEYTNVGGDLSTFCRKTSLKALGTDSCQAPSRVKCPCSVCCCSPTTCAVLETS